MKILIIEDEQITAEELERDILKAVPNAQILGRLESVEEAISFFESEEAPDLIFSDIQLADGLSFEIFEQIKPTCPVIFCTAFDEYAIQAFNNYGIDYILKPFNTKSIVDSIGKFQSLKSYFRKDKPAGEDNTNLLFNTQLEKLLVDLRPNLRRTSFLVHQRGKYFPVVTNDIAFFFTEHENVWLTHKNGEKYPINHSLDDLEKTLDSNQFYRANRQFIINFDAIIEFEPYFNRKLSIKLKVPLPEPLLVSKEKSSQFMRWMEQHHNF